MIFISESIKSLSHESPVHFLRRNIRKLIDDANGCRWPAFVPTTSSRFDSSNGSTTSDIRNNNNEDAANRKEGGFFPLEKKTRHDNIQDKDNSDSFFLLTKTLSAARSIQVVSTEGKNFMV